MIQGGYEIRRAVRADIDCLPEVERAAGALFDAYRGQTGMTDDVIANVNSIETFEKARETGRLWVAVAPGGQVVGFALVVELGRYAHLEELDVLPSHGQRGLGSALLDAVCSWAGNAGCSGVTLRTFRDVPWNEPFYQRRGFKIVGSSELSPEHVELEACEQQRGLQTDRRVSMVYSNVGSRSDGSVASRR
jgi:GNAT superfamily N-acetyltransferase